MGAGPAWEFRVQLGFARAREHVVHIEFAGGNLVLVGGLVLDLEIGDPVEAGLGGAETGRVLLGHELVAGAPVDQLVGSVDDDVLRLDPGITELLDRMLRHREGRVVAEQARQVGRGIFQRQLQRLVIDSPHAKLFRLQRARVHLLGILDQPEHRGVLRGDRRILDAAEGKHEIIRRHRHAVRPVVIAQLEGPDRAGRIDLPAGRHAGNGLAGRIIGRQADQHVADHDVFPLRRRLVRVERVDLGRDAAPQGRHIARLLLRPAPAAGGKRYGHERAKRGGEKGLNFHRDMSPQSSCHVPDLPE